MSLIRTTLQFGSIIQLAAQGLGEKTTQHGCGGTIEAKIESGTDKIVWQCAGCKDNGEINHWRGSGWDTIPDEKMPKIVVAPRKPPTPQKNKQTLRGTVVLSKNALIGLKKAVNDPKLDLLLLEARPLKGHGFALDLTIRELKKLYSLANDLLDFGPPRQRKMWDETLNSIGWAIDDISFTQIAKRRQRK